MRKFGVGTAFDNLVETKLANRHPFEERQVLKLLQHKCTVSKDRPTRFCRLGDKTKEKGKTIN